MAKVHRDSRAGLLTLKIKSEDALTRKIKRADRAVLFQRSADTATHKRMLGLVNAQAKRDGTYVPVPVAAVGSAIDKKAALYPMRVDELTVRRCRKELDRELAHFNSHCRAMPKSAAVLYGNLLA